MSLRGDPFNIRQARNILSALLAELETQAPGRRWWRSDFCILTALDVLIPEEEEHPKGFSALRWMVANSRNGMVRCHPNITAPVLRMLLLLEPCPACGGSGRFAPKATPPLRGVVLEPCPECRGQA